MWRLDQRRPVERKGYEMNTLHASLRGQQRGIPPFIDQLLDQYGHEEYDGHGGVIIYFDKRSRRRMEQDMGREPVRCLTGWLNTYKVMSTSGDVAITIGRRHKKVRRR
jgi:hypothetical protein